MSETGSIRGLPESPREGRNRWLSIALVGSIALNLFLVGVVGAWVLKPSLFSGRGPGGPPGLPTAASIADRIANRLPAADKPILQQAFQEHEKEIRDRLEEMRAAQQNFRRSLRTSPYDPAAFSAAFERLQEARGKANLAIHQAVRDAAGAMSHDGRIKMALPPPPRRG